MTASLEPERVVDAALGAWCQGDCVITGDHWFAYRVAMPNSSESDLREIEVRGFTVVTQTCDIRRRSGERPYVEICPLVEVSDATKFKEIERGRRPQFAFIPGIAHASLAADLDRVMTVEKAVVANWNRVEGCTTEDGRRRLTEALARKRVRSAFPNDFVEIVAPLTQRLQEKHDKQSLEGIALRALREIRVIAVPHWSAPKISITFWFIRNSESQYGNSEWAEYLQKWIDFLVPNDQFTHFDGQVTTLDDLTAREYLESSPLDLDHLSSGR